MQIVQGNNVIILNSKFVQIITAFEEQCTENRHETYLYISMRCSRSSVISAVTDIRIDSDLFTLIFIVGTSSMVGYNLTSWPKIRDMWLNYRLIEALRFERSFSRSFEYKVPVWIKQHCLLSMNWPHLISNDLTCRKELRDWIFDGNYIVEARVTVIIYNFIAINFAFYNPTPVK